MAVGKGARTKIAADAEPAGHTQIPATTLLTVGAWLKHLGAPIASPCPGAREFAQRSGEPSHDANLERPQEIEQILLTLERKRVEIVDDRVRLRSRIQRPNLAEMDLDSPEEVGSLPVVQKENALADSPKRRRPKLVT